MAEKKTYPSIPGSAWWGLRRRFKQSIPGRVDADYLQSVLGVQEGHAKNLISPLTAVGIIDDAGKPTDLATGEWRDDSTYPNACKTILESVYPDAVRDAFPPPNPDRAAVENWFARNAQVGQGAAGKMATFYLLLASADPSGENPAAKADGAAQAGRAARTGAPKPVAARRTAETAAKAAATTAGGGSGGTANNGPSVHVDVQVHISPEASAEQIDAIFASMSKHLYPKR